MPSFADMPISTVSADAHVHQADQRLSLPLPLDVVFQGFWNDVLKKFRENTGFDLRTHRLAMELPHTLIGGGAIELPEARQFYSEWPFFPHYHLDSTINALLSIMNNAGEVNASSVSSRYCISTSS